MTVRVEVEVEVRGNQEKIHLFPSWVAALSIFMQPDQVNGAV